MFKSFKEETKKGKVMSILIYLVSGTILFSSGMMIKDLIEHPSKLEISVHHSAKRDSTFLYNRKTGIDYLIKEDSTGKLNLVPYIEGK